MSRVPPLEPHQALLTEVGHSPIEVIVAKNDGGPVRNVTDALRDSPFGDDFRRVPITRFGNAKASGLKSLIEASSLDEIDLERVLDLPRDIDL